MLRSLLAERQEAHQHQQLLINELNHRVKNTLVVVQSIAAQTLRSAKVPPSTWEVFNERLMALAQAIRPNGGEVGKRGAPDIVSRISTYTAIRKGAKTPGKKQKFVLSPAVLFR